MNSRKAAGWAAGSAAALAAAAAFNAVAARKAESQFPPTGEVIDVDGVAIHYTDTGGDGPVIVLIHGNGSLVQDFGCSGLIERLAPGHRVIAFDRPGYGHSSRPNDREWNAEAQAAVLAAAARQLGVERSTIVGHSWGTLAALAWALDVPEMVSAMVLLSGYYYPTLRPDAVILNVAEVPIVGAVFIRAWAPLQARITGPLGFRQVFWPQDVPQRFLDAMPFGLMLRPSQIKATAEDGAHMPASARRLAERYHELDMPIVVMWGDGDKLVGQDDQSQRLVDELAVTAGMPTPGVGHMIHHSAPDAVAAAILRLADGPVWSDDLATRT